MLALPQDINVYVMNCSLAGASLWWVWLLQIKMMRGVSWIFSEMNPHSLVSAKKKLAVQNEKKKGIERVDSHIVYLKCRKTTHLIEIFMSGQVVCAHQWLPGESITVCSVHTLVFCCFIVYTNWMLKIFITAVKVWLIECYTLHLLCCFLAKKRNNNTELYHLAGESKSKSETSLQHMISAAWIDLWYILSTSACSLPISFLSTSFNGRKSGNFKIIFLRGRFSQIDEIFYGWER